jgi:hypothetical protein
MRNPKMNDEKPAFDVEFDPTILNEKPYTWNYEDKARQTLIEWQKITTAPDAIDVSIVTPDIKDSWLRSRSYGLNPFKMVDQKVLSSKDLKTCRRQTKR